MISGLPTHRPRLARLLKPLRQKSTGIERLTSPQGADDGVDVVFLEEADGGDSGCTGVPAGFGVLQSDASSARTGIFERQLG